MTLIRVTRTDHPDKGSGSLRPESRVTYVKNSEKDRVSIVTHLFDPQRIEDNPTIEYLYQTSIKRVRRTTRDRNTDVNEDRLRPEGDTFETDSTYVLGKYGEAQYLNSNLLSYERRWRD